MVLMHLVRLARPGHWVKNLIVLLPVVFAERMSEVGVWMRALPTALVFCLASSAVYVVNDIFDRRQDRLHPVKKHRPLAAGLVSMQAAIWEAGVLLSAAVVIALVVDVLVLAVVLAYLVMQAAYTLMLKRKMIVDVICVAIGFVLRAAAGAIAIRVEISHWLVICTFTACLFVGFCKRCNEIATLGPAGSVNHRHTLIGYTTSLLTHLITLSAAIAVVSFLLYATDRRTVDNFGTVNMVYTLPVVIYAIFRFAMLSMRGSYSDPVDIFLRDWPLQLTVAAWVAMVLVVLRWGEVLMDWLEVQGASVPGT